MSSTATTTVRARREKTYPRSKNRVGVFDAFSFSRTRSACSETPCSRRKKSSTPTTTASGMRYYGFRFYSPGLGRWVSRDPIEEPGFRTIRQTFSMKFAGTSRTELSTEERDAINKLLAEARRKHPQKAQRMELALSSKYGVGGVSASGLVQDVPAYLFTGNRPTSRYDILGLACGPGNGIGDKLIKDTPGGFDFGPCCQKHDDCYGKCDGGAKSSCDTAFLDCMNDICMDAPDAGKCSIWANLYFGAVTYGGQGPFDKARKCCP